ncbi:UvrD-helicase domain-containing protein [Thiomicrorhabdus sediminis]|uniref:DNA 3'-5' helicase n=1 Tax=Thiomicrorhabdus sediminis TaxID=2580412 RepID=A0A4P9K8L3_9GAMM|nr:UvrD-helicase domain-containing protein [Thiomicrorhabdus sediminis]QCU90657.1 hypothetical protein FE785_08425 [Thiomicrorhabdus sediminis]
MKHDTQHDLFAEQAAQPEVMNNHSTDLLSQYGLQCDNALADGPQRFQAINPLHSYIVQAPAGSGKTSLLAQRFLALLSQVEAPEQILAMTFTKKAAAEMRERILKALQSGVEPLSDDASLVDANTWKLAQQALRRDAEQGWSLLKNPNRLRIKTIDGLNSYLVTQMPLLSKMGGQSRIVDDANDIYLQAVRATLKDKALTEAVGRLLRLVNGRFNRAENLLTSMLAKRDQWMRTLLQFQGDEARFQLEGSLAEIVEQSLAQSLDAIYYLSGAFDKACQIADYAQNNDQPQLAVLSNAWPLQKSIEDASKWQVLAQWVLTKDGKSIRKRLTKNEGFPSGKGEAAEQKSAFAEVLETIQAAVSTDAKVLAALQLLKNLPQPHYSDQQWQDLQWLIQILVRCLGYLQLAFQQVQQVDHIEVAQAASLALGSELEPTELAQQLDYQIQHLLVDEFQDTSSEQYRLLTQLVAGWQPDDGRTLFLVGDPMQSIYRFREAEVGNFLTAWQGRIGEVALKPLSLAVNFRSSAAVIDWVNFAFKKVLPKENAIEKGAVSYSDSIAASDNREPAIFTDWQLNQSAQQEAEKVVELVKARLQEFAQQPTGKKRQIAILGRSRSSLISIANELKQQAVPFRAVDLQSLHERQEVQDILALTRALLHSADRGAWVALLRSPLVGLNLPDLHRLLDLAPYKTAVHALNNWQKHPEQNESVLSTEANQRLQTAWPLLQRAINAIGRTGLAQLVKEVWLMLDGPQTVDSEMALQNIDVFCQTLQQAIEDSQGGSLDWQKLELYLAKLYARPDSSPESEQVELMTMHKSKGLEFDTVILPGLGRAPRGDDAALVSWFQFMDDAAEEHLVIAPIDQKGTNESPLRTLLKGFETEKQRYELGRVLYVAATRAKQQLHLFGQVSFKIDKADSLPKPAKDSLLESLWPVVENDFIDLAQACDEDPQQASDMLLPWPKVPRLRLQRNGFEALSALAKQQAYTATELTPLKSALKEMTLTEIDDEGHSTSAQGAEMKFSVQNALLNTSVGNLVHAIFEQWAQTGFSGFDETQFNRQKPAYEFWLSQAGLSAAELNQALQRVKRSLLNASTNAKMQWALSGEHQQAAEEYALTSMTDNQVSNHIIDRTFIDATGVRWIIDYKTSVYKGEDKQQFVEYHSEKYLSQLQRYGELFDQLEQRDQKWVLYFSDADIWHELN